MSRFVKTRLLMFEKAKKLGLLFTNEDIIKIHDLLNVVEMTLDYNLLTWYTEQLKEILEPIRQLVVWG